MEKTYQSPAGAKVVIGPKVNGMQEVTVYGSDGIKPHTMLTDSHAVPGFIKTANLKEVL